MSKYTTELRFICEHLAGLDESKGAEDVDSIISTARPKIFDFDYPIFDVNYKPILEAKILDHYYTREIGLETYGLWKQKLRAKMREIMPYYNKMYESELIEFNPLYDTDLRVDGNRITDGTTGGQDVSRAGGTDTRATNDKNNTWDLYSDTPQGGVNGILGAEDDPSIGSNAFLTNARHVFGDTTGSTGSTTYGRTDTTDYGKTNRDDSTYWETVKGYRGANPSKSLKEFRTTFLNIDMLIIDELRDLFFQLW